LFSFDDAAWSSLNPLPGTLYNAPSGQDVRETCRVDYRGPQVTVQNFMHTILRQNVFRSTEKFLNSQAGDNVFMYFVDHGSTGMLLFPSGEVFPATELHAMIDLMKVRGKFGNMLIFVEACESGSLFESFQLPNSVLAVTAANSTESSWGTYCPSDFGLRADIVDNVLLNTCLGDMFSVNWINALETSPTSETVSEFLIRVANATRKSEVNYYGDDKLLALPIGNFLGSNSRFILS
jgi:legumain